MKLVWSRLAWEDYQYWLHTDKQILKRINALIKEISRTPYAGTGKPEPLKHNWTGWWSRRIDREHRLVYRVSDDAIEIAQCRYHY